MFADPRFMKRIKVPLPIVHEEISQSIQGGLPGEHYHVSAALLEALITNLSAPRLYSEVIASISGASMSSLSGDLMYNLIVTNFVPGNVQSTPTSGGAPTTSTPPAIPDVITPVVTPPVTSVDHDIYYNQVVALSNMNVVLGSATVPTQDAYHSIAGPSGAATGAVGANTLPIFGHNSLLVNNPSASIGTFSFLFIDPREASSAIPVFSDVFAWEQWALMRTVGTDFFLMVFGSGQSQSKQQVYVTISPDGTGQIETYYNGSPTGLIVPFVHNITRNVFHHFVIERTVDNIVTFYADGVIKAQLTLAGTIGAAATGAFCYAHAYGGYRITKGVPRFNKTAFAPPTAEFLTA